MRYLSLAEALTIAEAVTGIDTITLAKASRLELLDSGHVLATKADDAVAFMLGVAAGEIDEDAAEVWIPERIEQAG